jgi:AraC-like DNA-binding protein
MLRCRLNRDVAISAMTDHAAYPPIEGGLIQSVLLVDQLVRPTACAFSAPSLPGHLIHYVVEGEVEQELNGQRQRLAPGSVVWYHENEAVRGHIRKSPWVYFTANFTARRLPPPPFDQRVSQGSAEVGRRFQSLLDAWRAVNVPPLMRHMRVFTLLMELLTDVMPSTTLKHRMDMGTHLWWEIEAKVREDLSGVIDLRRLQSLARCGRQSIIRACHLAVGMPPMKRVKQMRLSYARGLVLHSRLPMTEIALRVGYGRVQELSRDYHKKYGVAPTDDRQAGPDYWMLYPRGQ